MIGAEHAAAPVWAAALNAAACRAVLPDGIARPIQWIPGPSDCVRYGASEDVVIEPFGIALAGGSVLEVGWGVGETGYSLKIHVPGA